MQQRIKKKKKKCAHSPSVPRRLFLTDTGVVTTPSHQHCYHRRYVFVFFVGLGGGLCIRDRRTEPFFLVASTQVSSPLQRKQSGQSETIDIFQKEGLSSVGGGIQVAPPNHRCRPCPWPRHGQQREWADVLRRSAGQLRRLKNGRGRLQVQRLYRGASRAAKLPSVVVEKKSLFFSSSFFKIESTLLFDARYLSPPPLCAFWQLSRDHEALTHVLFGRNLRLKVAQTLWRRNASEFVAYLTR